MSDSPKPGISDDELDARLRNAFDRIDAAFPPHDPEKTLAAVRAAAAKPKPYPTPTRLRLMRNIADGELRHYAFVRPETRNTVTDGLYTARVAELVAADLADYGQPDEFRISTVVLTEAGRTYLDTYGKNGETP